MVDSDFALSYKKDVACCKLIVEIFFFFNFNLFFVWVEFNGFSMVVWIVVVVIDAVTVVPLLGYMLLFWCCVELSAFVAIFLFLSCRILLWLMLLLWNPLRIYIFPQTLRFERGIFRYILFSFGLLCEKLQWVVKSSGFLCIYMNQKRVGNILTLYSSCLFGLLAQYNAIMFIIFSVCITQLHIDNQMMNMDCHFLTTVVWVNYDVVILCFWWLYHSTHCH